MEGGCRSGPRWEEKADLSRGSRSLAVAHWGARTWSPAACRTRCAWPWQNRSRFRFAWRTGTSRWAQGGGGPVRLRSARWTACWSGTERWGRPVWSWATPPTDTRRSTCPRRSTTSQVSRRTCVTFVLRSCAVRERFVPRNESFGWTSCTESIETIRSFAAGEPDSLFVPGKRVDWHSLKKDNPFEQILLLNGFNSFRSLKDSCESSCSSAEFVCLFVSSAMVVVDGKPVRLQLCDTAGQVSWQRSGDMWPWILWPLTSEHVLSRCDRNGVWLMDRSM